MQTNSLRNLHIIIFIDLSLTSFVAVNFVIIRKIYSYGYGMVVVTGRFKLRKSLPFISS